MRKQVVLYITLILSVFGQSQNELTKIVELHRQNMSDLSVSRGGLPEEWIIPKDFDENHLSLTLNYFYATKNVGILIFSHTNDSLHITLLDKKGVSSNKKIKITKQEIEKLIIDTNLFLANSSGNIEENRGSKSKHLNKDDSAYDQINKLIFPETSKLEALEHLIIVPTLNIGTLPFSALKISKNSFLIDQMSYSISPSIFEIYATLKKVSRSSFDPSFYDFNKSLFIYKTDFEKSINSNFADLKYTEDEVLSISSNLDRLNTTVLGNNEATIPNFYKYINQSELVYIATHGMASSSNPLDESYIVLTDDSIPTKNSFLTAKLIQDLRYKSGRGISSKKIAILSACETGKGASHSGGIIGLSRAFQIAGFNHVLMSLWNISDLETAKFMTIFFDILQKSNNEHLEPHNSLQKAILKFRKTVSDNPKHWAAFSIFGVPNPAKNSYGSSSEQLNVALEKTQKIKNLEHKLINANSDLEFDFKLIRLDNQLEKESTLYESYLPNKNVPLRIKENDSMILQITNKSKYPLYINILEINSNWEINHFMPNDYCPMNNNECLIPAGKTVTLDTCIFYFAPPFETLTLKGFATKEPLDLKHIINEIDNDDFLIPNISDGFSTEFVYEIIKKKN